MCRDFYNLIFIFIFTALAAGCSSTPPKETQDIPKQYTEKMTEMENETGFNYGWIDYAAIKKYDEVIVDAKLSKNMIPNTGWEDFNSRRMFYSKDEDDQYVQSYCEEALKDAFVYSKEFKITDKPDDKALCLNFYIVQIVANKIIVGAASNLIMPTPIGWILVPAKLALQYSSENQGGSIATEIVLSDSMTGKIVAIFASREKGPTAFFDKNRMYAYANIRQIINIWAMDVVAALDQIKEGKTELEAAKTMHPFKLQDRLENNRLYKRFNSLLNN